MTLTQVSERRGQTTVIKRKTVCVRLEFIVRTVFESYNDCNGFWDKIDSIVIITLWNLLQTNKITNLLKLAYLSSSLEITRTCTIDSRIRPLSPLTGYINEHFHMMYIQPSMSKKQACSGSYIDWLCGKPHSIENPVIISLAEENNSFVFFHNCYN